MSPSNSLERLLEMLKENPDIEEVTLISRSGMHIAGNVPEHSHRETFVAMSAILLGAAETATSELKEELSYIVIELKNCKIIVLNGGPKALLSMKVLKRGDLEKIMSDTPQIISKMQDYL